MKKLRVIITVVVAMFLSACYSPEDKAVYYAEEMLKAMKECNPEKYASFSKVSKKYYNGLSDSNQKRYEEASDKAEEDIINKQLTPEESQKFSAAMEEAVAEGRVPSECGFY